MILLAPISKLQSYDSVADEYYDAARHPTCHNFRELSERFIAPRLTHELVLQKPVLEVGAGRSIVAPLIADCGVPFNQLVLLDSSDAMLSYSRQWECRGAKLVVADARWTEFADASFSAIVASLGDPYNCPSFWKEVARLLRRGGICLFTCPAFEWATRLRNRDSLECAEFLLRGNKIVNVPSYAPPLEKQLEMICNVDLAIREVVAFCRSDLRHPASPKLNVFNDTTSPIIVRGFRAEKTS